MKKAQMAGQIFVFLLSALTLSMILILGYKYIDSFMEKQKTLEIIQFRDDLLNSINSIRTRYGSIDRIILNFPAGHSEVCFVDSEDSGKFNTKRPLLFNLWSSSNKKQNIFFTPLQEIEIKADDLEVQNGYCCIAQTKSIEIKLESKGKKVMILPWEENMCVE